MDEFLEHLNEQFESVPEDAFPLVQMILQGLPLDASNTEAVTRTLRSVSLALYLSEKTVLGMVQDTLRSGVSSENVPLLISYTKGMITGLITAHLVVVCKREASELETQLARITSILEGRL